MADDDKNDKLMEQFIAKATPKLLEAMTTQITEQVETRIKPLVDNSTKMLDQIQDAKREREERDQKQAEDFGQLKTLLKRGGAPADVKKTLEPDPIVLTRDQARDPALYRRAKAQAEANGTVVKIAVDGDA